MKRYRIQILVLAVLLAVSTFLTLLTVYIKDQGIYDKNNGFYDVPEVEELTESLCYDFINYVQMGNMKDSFLSLNDSNIAAKVYEDDKLIYQTRKIDSYYEEQIFSYGWTEDTQDNTQDYTQKYVLCKFYGRLPANQEDDYRPLYQKYVLLKNIRYIVIALNVFSTAVIIEISWSLLWKKRLFNSTKTPLDIAILCSAALASFAVANAIAFYGQGILISIVALEIASLICGGALFYIMGILIEELRSGSLVSDLYIMNLKKSMRIVIIGVSIFILQLIITLCLYNGYLLAGIGQILLMIAETGLVITYIRKNDERISHMVDEQVKNERMKTELITNVSHDLKTPVTSIVNYMDLIMKEDIDNDRAKEYLEVINRQTVRLKKLVCDVVEASKAASGNTQINLSDISIKEILNQSVAEYEDKLQNKELDVQMYNELDCQVSADGDALWRVFDNVLCNICKYSLSGTRVYITVTEDDDVCMAEFKNISKDRLNISSEELMERFVRGDESRNTDGSGLGLAIARSLMELMGGMLEIQIDGDLFKVTVVMNKANISDNQ